MDEWEKETARKESGAPRDPSAGAFQLAVLSEQGAVIWPLDARVAVTVGRAQDASIPLNDPGVSRLHLCIEVGAAVQARDLGSSNGTRYRGRLLARGESVALTPGDVLELGATLLVLQARGAAGEAGEAPRDAAVTAARAMPWIVLEDPATRRVATMLERVAVGMISVLLLGETGVGKEIFAELVHRLSPRREAPFVRLNCAALSEGLIESELFGHERGAFTGAVATKPGLLESAAGGTVFLDEVGELPPSIQVKLLRVLEERRVTRVGALKPRDIDVRVVAATHRDLHAEMEAARFREDLYFRLAGITLEIPPLRERAADVAALAAHFLGEGARRAGRSSPPALSPAALSLLRQHDWPGNLRELRNAMERAVLLAGDGPIEPAHVQGLGARRRPQAPPASAPAPTPTPTPRAAEDGGDLRGEVAALEKQRILDALQRSAGNQTLAAKLLGMPRRTFLNRLDAYNIARPRKGDVGEG